VRTVDRKFPEEETIRRYLLGALREPESSDIEQKLLSNEELSQTVALIEGEIIEEYLDGDLDEPNKKAVETYFLRPQEHRKKMQFARLLRHHFALGAAAQPMQVPIRPPQIGPHHFLLRYGGAAAMIVLSVLCLFLSVSQRDLKKKATDSQKARAVLQAALAQERENSAALEEKLRTLQASSAVTLDLKPGVTRGGGGVPGTIVQPTTRLIRVDLLLPYASSASFSVRLLDRGEQVWSDGSLRATPSLPLSRLLFDMPAQGIRSGHYEIVVNPEPSQGKPITYPFDVRVVQ
jgi:hypothetical protein